MKPLEPPDAFHLRAAEGWLGLGDHESANQELERISPQLRAHRDVLDVRYSVCAKAKNWDAAAEIGRMLVELEPNQSFGWVNRSYALRRSSEGSVQAAYEALRPGADRPLDDLEQVAFNLACYACQLGRLDEAREWLAKAFSAAKSNRRINQRKQEALDDSDLELLWGEIRDSN